MLIRTMLVMVCCGLAGTAAAAPLDVCPTLATGHWTIVSVGTDDRATAMSGEEARSYIGKKAIISERHLVFGPQRCEIAKSEAHYVPDAWYTKPGFTYSVILDCTVYKEMPLFLIGRSCKRMLATLDGWNFILRKTR